MITFSKTQKEQNQKESIESMLKIQSLEKQVVTLLTELKTLRKNYLRVNSKFYARHQKVKDYLRVRNLKTTDQIQVSKILRGKD